VPPYNAPKAWWLACFVTGKETLLQHPLLRVRGKEQYVDILVQESGVNTTIAEERYFVVSLALHFKASPFGDG